MAEERLSPTERVLLLALRPQATEPERDEAERLLAGGEVDAASLVDLAEQHAVTGWLYERLRRLELLGALLEAQQRRLRDWHRHLAARNLALLGAVTPVVRGLQREGAPVVLLKGLALALRDYRSLALRAMCDVDLLVPGEHAERTEELCREGGFEPERGHTLEYCLEHRGSRHFFGPTTNLGRLDLDVQFRLTLPGQHPFRLDGAELLARAQTVERQGERWPCLGPEDELLHLVYHQYRHEFEGLRCACDTAVLLAAHPELDWDAVLERAYHARLQHVLYAGLLLTRRTLGAEAPEEAWRRLQPGAGRGWVLGRVLTARQSATAITPDVRRWGRGRHWLRMGLLACGPGLGGPVGLLADRFWRHPEEVWRGPDEVPEWARSKPRYAAHRLLALGSRTAKVLTGAGGDEAEGEG